MTVYVNFVFLDKVAGTTQGCSLLSLYSDRDDSYTPSIRQLLGFFVRIDKEVSDSIEAQDTEGIFHPQDAIVLQELENGWLTSTSHIRIGKPSRANIRDTKPLNNIANTYGPLP